MSSKTSKLAQAAITVEAGSQTYTLTPNLRAVRAIEAKFGGLISALHILGTGNLSATAFVIAAGAGLDTNKRKELEAVEEAVFEGGVNHVGSQTVKLIEALLNPGGKTREQIEAEQEEAGNASE